MSPLADHQIVDLVAKSRLLDPFFEDHLNPCGYDLSLSPYFKLPILDNEVQVIDPFQPPAFTQRTQSESIIIPAHSFILGASIEYVKMPSDIVGICLGRSTYARAGVISHVTPLEPGWEGNVTIEISNTNPLPVRVWVNKGITQVLFFRADEPPTNNYVSKGGRYQGQTGVQQGLPDRLPISNPNSIMSYRRPRGASNA